MNQPSFKCRVRDTHVIIYLVSIFVIHIPAYHGGKTMDNVCLAVLCVVICLIIIFVWRLFGAKKDKYTVESHDLRVSPMGMAAVNGLYKALRDVAATSDEISSITNEKLANFGQMCDVIAATPPTIANYERLAETISQSFYGVMSSDYRFAAENAVGTRLGDLYSRMSQQLVLLAKAAQQLTVSLRI